MKNIQMLHITISCFVKPSEDSKEKEMCACTLQKSYLTLIFTVAHLILERKDHCHFMPYFLCDNTVNGNANLFLYQAITSKLAVTNLEKWNLIKNESKSKMFLRSL